MWKMIILISNLYVNCLKKMNKYMEGERKDIKKTEILLNFSILIIFVSAFLDFT